MKTYKVTIYKETYTEVIVKANNENDANDLVMMGKYNTESINDITVKESEIMDTKEIN